MSKHTEELLSTEGLELERYTNEDEEFCVDATLTNYDGRPTETIRFKRGDEVEIEQANGEYIIGKVIGPPVFNKISPSAHVDHFKNVIEDADRTLIVDVTHVTVNGQRLPQLTPQQILVDPSETSLFQDKLEAFIRLQDEMDFAPEMAEEEFPEPDDLDTEPA